MGVSFVRALGFGVKVIPARTSFFSKFIGSCANRSYGRSFLEGPALLAAIVISNWVVSELILPKIRTRQCRVLRLYHSDEESICPITKDQ